MGKRRVELFPQVGSFAESRAHAGLMEAIYDAGTVPCQDQPDLFFAEDEATTTYREAKMLCRQCPVIGLCGDYAIRFNMSEGVWGGFTPADRRRVRLKVSRGESLNLPAVKDWTPEQKEKVVAAGRVNNRVKAVEAGKKAQSTIPEALAILGDSCPVEWRVVAEVRLANPELSLVELGKLFDPVLPKDVIAGRLRRLQAVARKKGNK